MPPKAETGSQRSARSQAWASEAPSDTPQGLACLTMTIAGLSNSATHSKAASVSFRLLKDSSLPCTWVAVAMPGRLEPSV